MIANSRSGASRATQEDTMHRCAAIALLIAASAAHAQSALTLHHVHGLAYSADGTKLMVPSHYGLALYSEGRWTKAPGPEHDYMGFSATRRHLYSSGHPARGSGLKNPFGLIRSRDGGKTWERLGLEGESDFHLLAAGWNTDAIYVWNPEPNSRMRRAGLHYTLDGGATWKEARASGLKEAPLALAVHPDDPRALAVAAKSGFYLSTDSGDSFRPIARGAQGLAVFFDLDGEHLWMSGYAGSPLLARGNLGTGTKRDVALPPLGRDAVAYIAQNPAKRDEYAIATFERSVYVSMDGGRTWTRIARNGETR